MKRTVRLFTPAVLLGVAFLAPVVASAQETNSVERVTGPVQSEVEAYDEALQRFRARMEEFTTDARAIVDQLEREEREKITFGYEVTLTDLSDQETQLRDLAITRFEYFLQKYPDSEYTAHVMFRLAELYFELANEEWSQAAEEYRVLENNTAEEDLFDLPPEPTRDYSRSIALYETILREHPNYEYLDGTYYMLGYCYNEPLSTQYAEDPFGSEDVAKEYFRKLVEQFPDSPFSIDGNFILGEAYFADNDIEQAIPHFSAVVEKADSSHNLYDKGLYMLAWSHYKLSDYGETLGLFTRLLDYSDEIFQQSGQDSALKPEAIEYSAISFSDLSDRSLGFDDPDWEEYAGPEMYGVQALFQQIGLPQGYHTPVDIAGAWFDHVGDREFEIEIVKELAQVLVAQARYEEAISTYEFIQEKWPNDPENPNYQFEVARLYMTLPIPDEEASSAALATLNERYSEGGDWWIANRNNPDAQNNARRYIEQSLAAVAVEIHTHAQRTGEPSDYARAAEKYREYLTKFPFADDYYEIEWYLADTLYNSRQYEDAIVEYKQLLKTQGHPYVDGSRFQLFRAYSELVTQTHGPPDVLPQNATVERTVETASGAQRNVYALSDEHKALIQAADDLAVAEFTDPDWSSVLDENQMALMYIPGQILYTHGDYEGARERLMKVIETYPQTEEGEYSASVVINTYTNDGDLENVVLWTQTFLQWRPPLGPDSADRDVKEGWGNNARAAEFKLCGRLATANDALGAGECYETWFRSYPEEQNARFALYNAANNLEKGGKADQANDLFEEYLNTYPKDEASKDLYFRIATNYASILELDKAIGYYENLYKYFGPRKLGTKHHVDAPNALYMAGFLRTGTGDFVGAAENFEEYVSQFPEANDREQVAWVAGEQWKKVSDEKALAYYKKYLRSFPSDNPDHVIDALYWIVQYETEKGNNRRIEAAWKELEDNYARLAAEGPMGPMARNRAAEAAFRKLQVQFDEFAGDDYPKGEEKLISFLLEDKVDEYKAIEAEALQIIETYADFEYSSAAIYIWGSAYLAYAEYLYNVPMPKEFQGNFELEDIWYQKWSEQATPIEEKAIARFEANLQKAKTEKRSSVWIDRTIVALNDINPSAYPLEKPEIRGDSDASVIPNSGPLSQPEPEASEEGE